LGSGDINLIDDTLNINQQINAQNGNIVITGGNGLVFGQFAMFSNTIATQNPSANINIGRSGDTGYVDIERPLSVNSTGGGSPAFLVEKTGVVEIRTYGNIASNTAALLINGTTSGNDQPRNFEGTLIQATAQDNTPARMSADAFGVDGTGQNAYVAWAGRAARGNVNTPSQTLAGDTIFRFTGQGWSNSGAYIGSIVRYNQVALENFATGKAGTRHNFAATPVGSATIKNIANIDANGISFSNVAAGGFSNIGITFTDGSYQNTAYIPTSVVRSLTAGSGIQLSASTGNITIQNSGVLGVLGTTNQINVSNVGNVLTLSLPQNLNTTANIQLNQLTVNDLIILGNVSNVTANVIGGKIIYVANTATNLEGINTSGLVTGNAANGFYAGMLYNTTSNTWVMDIGNSVGITSDTIYTTEITANGNIHLGNVDNNYDFVNALLQGDTSVDTYSQYVLKNHSQTANASADIVAVANNGDDDVHYIDMGINSNVYANTNYAVTRANDGYLYVNGGNLVIGTQTAGNVINFFTGGTNNLNNVRGTISDTGLSMVGNVTANNIISTNATIGGIVSATGNITGGNLLIPAGQISASGNLAALNVNTTIVSATGNIRGANVNTGIVSATGNITGGNLSIPVGVANIGNITTSNITAGNITSAIISATGNITGSNIVATILTVSSILSVTGNITGGNLLTSGIISTTGNITANLFFGDGGQLSNINVAKIANGTSQVNIPIASGNANITIGGTSNVAVFSTTGEYVTGLVSVTGNVIGGNLITGGLITATGNVTGANIRTAGLVTATGNITGGNVSVVGNTTTANLSVTGISNLNSNANVKISGGATGQQLTTDGTGNLYWSLAQAGNTIIQSAANTTINIDFTTNSLHLLYLPTGPVTISLSNYTAGAQARVIVRYGATPYTIALGVGNVQQSTEGVTTIPTTGAGGHKIGSNQSVQLLYTCFDSTPGNCYVASTFL
jgi:hypothetical protein